MHISKLQTVIGLLKAGYSRYPNEPIPEITKGVVLVNAGEDTEEAVESYDIKYTATQYSTMREAELALCRLLDGFVDYSLVPDNYTVQIPSDAKTTNLDKIKKYEGSAIPCGPSLVPTVREVLRSCGLPEQSGTDGGGVVNICKGYFRITDCFFPANRVEFADFMMDVCPKLIRFNADGNFAPLLTANVPFSFQNEADSSRKIVGIRLISVSINCCSNHFAQAGAEMTLNQMINIVRTARYQTKEVIFITE